jgi:phosphatidylserine/phosphatidylglycerophosphate/cardiolipin synthase-like enzyme
MCRTQLADAAERKRATGWRGAGAATALLFLSLTLALSGRPFNRALAQDVVSTALGGFTSAKLLLTPGDGQAAFAQALASAKKVNMTMYHLTEPGSIQALLDAAARGASVRVLLDGKSLQTPRYAEVAKRLTDGGVDARASSSAFALTHSKAMTIDGTIAFITSINLTRMAASTRDFGLVIRDPDAIAEIDRVFEADWQNAQDGTANTPELSSPALLWSPVSAGSKLAQLIGSAQASVSVMAENLGEAGVMKALGDAAAAGRSVRVLVSACDKNFNPHFNYPYLKELVARGAQARTLPAPETPEQPYIHAKMILVDSERAYVGSANFSRNSLLCSRELGALVADREVLGNIARVFEDDWAKASAPADPPPDNCPRFDPLEDPLAPGGPDGSDTPAEPPRYPCPGAP